MENATKALIIAGAVLIGIILLSIGVALWRNYSNFSKENAQSTRAQQLEEFNVKFKKYEYNLNAKKDDEKNYITAQDVRTIANLAKDYNDKNNDKIIKVISYIKGFVKNDLTKVNEAEWVEFLNSSNPTGKNGDISAQKYIAIMDNDNGNSDNGNSDNGNSDIITSIKIYDK